MFARNFCRNGGWAPFSETIKRFGFHFLQQQLDCAVFEVEQVLEHKHLIDDLLREFRVEFLHVFDHGFFVRRST